MTSALRLILTVSPLKAQCYAQAIKREEQTHVMGTMEDPRRFVTMVKSF